MSKIKNAIREKIVSPELSSLSSFSCFCKVLKTNEATKECLVNFIDAHGKERKENVPVRLSCAGVLDWFPEIDETVHLIESEGEFLIDSPSPETVFAKLSSDIFSDSCSSNGPGMVGV